MGRLAHFVIRWPLAVIAAWIAAAVALPLLLPTLGEMADRHPLSILPADAASNVTAQRMAAAFGESGTEALLLVVLIDDDGLTRSDEVTYRELVDELSADTENVVMLQDFISTPLLRPVVTSEDHKAWVLPVGLAGELGTPQSFTAFGQVSAVIKRIVDGSGLTAHLTGPAATVADLTVAGNQDRLVIESAIGILVLIVLLVIYRRPLTMMLPLISIAISLLIAQALVAGYSQLTGSGVSNQSIVFLSAIMTGAGTDYAVFLISRYHDYLRSGAESDQAVRGAMISIGKVIGASAATVGFTFLAISFARMGVFQTVGTSSAIGIGLAFLAAITLLPAILALAGPRGWVGQRRDLTTRFWRRSGVRIVRRPGRYLAASMLVLICLASCAGLVRYNYDDRKALSAAAPSSLGYAALGEHYPVNQSIPAYLLVQSPNDLRTPEALADLEQMAQRVSQIPDIVAVNGITRPTGTVPEEFRATYQAGAVGALLAEGAELIDSRSDDLNRLKNGSTELADELADVRIKVISLATRLQNLITTFAGLFPTNPEFNGKALVNQVDTAAKLVVSLNELGNSIGVNFSAAKDFFGWIGPVLAALEGNPVCEMSASCRQTRSEFRRVLDTRNNGEVNRINELMRQLQSSSGNQTVNESVERLNKVLAELGDIIKLVGLDRPGGLRANLARLRDGADRAADGSREVADGVTELVDQVKSMGVKLDTAAAFLLSLQQDASNWSMAGFNIPPQVFFLAEFTEAAKIFIAPDGHSVRYLVQTGLNPFSAEAMDQIGEITATARSALIDTSLSEATVSVTGYTANLRDIRAYYQYDIRFIIIVTLVVVFVTLITLLRTVIAPLYLVASVVLSYLSAVGIGALTFQVLLGQQLHWSVPPLAFVVLVAVGADYNMLLISRMRDESPRSIRYGIIRTLGSTGGVITAAGLIFAASMFGLLFSSINTVVQGGFVIGMGILLDTFLVRTMTVPAIATFLGEANWWPAQLRRSTPY